MALNTLPDGVLVARNTDGISEHTPFIDAVNAVGKVRWLIT